MVFSLSLQYTALFCKKLEKLSKSCLIVVEMTSINSKMHSPATRRAEKQEF